ncbi:hypothetical protein C1T17_10135 [Sphingobium sp. SCG-1]|nr:hypothetical protein C1T17_10135 [Sphingobium sp. SCG-1]
MALQPAGDMTSAVASASCDGEFVGKVGVSTTVAGGVESVGRAVFALEGGVGDGIVTRDAEASGCVIVTVAAAGFAPACAAGWLSPAPPPPQAESANMAATETMALLDLCTFDDLPLDLSTGMPSWCLDIVNY